MESAENLVEMGMAISPVPLSQLKPEPVLHCPVMVQMIPGENYGVWFHEKIDVIQSQKKGFLNLQTTRVRKVKEVKVYVDVDGMHSLHQPKEHRYFLSARGNKLPI
jgi:hypothetical protein